MGRHLVDLTNKKFGRFTVLKLDEEKTKLVCRPYWICKCDCGNIVSVKADNLRSGQSQSCGCLREENKFKSKFVDITGQKFGLLTVLEYEYEKSKIRKKTYWKCRCDCGNITSVFCSDLTHGRILSCGCIRIENLIGKKFGRLTVLELSDKRSNGSICWRCKCDCGNEIIVTSYYLKSGHTRSCGCLSRELTSIRSSKSNKIEFDEDRGCYKCYFFNCEDFFLFDLEDLDIIKQHCWHKNRYGYAISYTVDENKKYHGLLCHRFIMSKYINISNILIDHENANTLDNRKLNLRPATPSQNSTNSKPRSKIGEKYISYNNKNHKYIFQKKGTKSKVFNNKEDAIKYRNNYLLNNPDEFEYNVLKDSRLKLNNIVYPFKFIDPNKIISPFVIVDKEKFYSSL